MKFERGRSFAADWTLLTDDEREAFRRTVPKLHVAAERQVSKPGSGWPASLRVKSVEAAPGAWEMGWSSAGADGRATFEWADIDGAPGIRWRRIGSHTTFRQA